MKHCEWMTQWRFTSRKFGCSKFHRSDPPPRETSIAQRSTPDLVLWSMSLVEYSNQLRKKGRPEARTFPTVRMQRRRPREIGAAAPCEPEPQTIHITDNPTKKQSSRSSWLTTALCRTHQARSCSQSWICWTLLSA